MKRYKFNENKFMLFICFLIFLFGIAFNSINVYAENTSGGTGTTWPGCSNCNWLINLTGVRLSLYRYDGNSLNYYGYKDHCADNEFGCFTGAYSSAIQPSNKAGKVAHQKINGYEGSSSNWSNGTITADNSQEFPDINNWTNVENYTKSLFSLTSNNRNSILSKLKSEFSGASSLKVTDLDYIYITIEPTARITEVSTQNHYYGTAYELIYNFGGRALEGVNGVVFYDLPSIMMAQTSSGNDKNGFIGKYVELVPTSSLVSRDRALWDSSARDTNRTLTISSKGYGINVFWLGSYIPELPKCTITEQDKFNYNLNITGDKTGISYGISNKEGTINNSLKYEAKLDDTNIYGTIKDSSGVVVATCKYNRAIPTCKQTCTKDDLSCMENYCHTLNSNTKDKASCMNTCGYSDPGFSSCGEIKNTKGKDTICSKTTSSSKQVCTKASIDNYYKTTCKETSKIAFGESLPTTLLPGASFKYNPTLSGNKKCKIEFEIDKWVFDYISSYTKEEKDKLLSILEEYEKLLSSKNLDKDIYEYDSSNAKIILEISKDIQDEDVDKKELEKESTKNLLSNEFEIEKGKEVSISLYESLKKIDKKIISYIEINSSNETKYQLPGICINNETKEIYEMKDGKCNTEEDGPYYEYFTDEKIKNGEYSTFVTVKKVSSNMNVDNTCHYGIEEVKSPPTGDSNILLIAFGAITALSIGFISYRKMFVK